MLVQRNLRLCSNWLKCATNQLTVSSLFFPCHVLRAHHFSSDCSRPFDGFCSGHIWQRMFYKTGHRKFATGPVPSLCVGEKAVVSMKITSDMVKCFAQATGDWNPIHFEAGNLNTKSEKCDGRKDDTDQLKKVPIVHGALLNGIVSGVIGTRLPGPGTVVVSQVFKFAAPLLVGGQVSVEVEVMNFRRREVNVKYKIVSIPDETVVMDGTARLLVPRDRIGKVS